MITETEYTQVRDKTALVFSLLEQEGCVTFREKDPISLWRDIRLSACHTAGLVDSPHERIHAEQCAYTLALLFYAVPDMPHAGVAQTARAALRRGVETERLHDYAVDAVCRVITGGNAETWLPDAVAYLIAATPDLMLAYDVVLARIVRLNGNPPVGTMRYAENIRAFLQQPYETTQPAEKAVAEYIQKWTHVLGTAYTNGEV
jgi:hypothetical protein